MQPAGAAVTDLVSQRSHKNCQHGGEELAHQASPSLKKMAKWPTDGQDR